MTTNAETWEFSSLEDVFDTIDSHHRRRALPFTKTKPRSRRRALTNPSTQYPSIRNTHPQFSPQLESQFCRLPLEIRLRIYEFVLPTHPEYVIHILTDAMRRASSRHRETYEHFTCERFRTEPDSFAANPGPCADWSCFQGTFGKKIRYGGDHANYLEISGHRERSTKEFGLMRCCRMTYREVIPLIYSRLHFHFISPMHYLQLSRRVPRHHFRKIHFLSLDFHPANFCRFEGERIDTKLVYSTALEYISSMKLREFKIFAHSDCFSFTSPKWRKDSDVFFQESLKSIKGPEVMEVIIPRASHILSSSQWKGIVENNVGTGWKVWINPPKEFTYNRRAESSQT